MGDGFYDDAYSKPKRKAKPTPKPKKTRKLKCGDIVTWEGGGVTHKGELVAIGPVWCSVTTKYGGVMTISVNSIHRVEVPL